ncbi:MAG: BsaWI family type II restriction enzyme [bacterium]|nr:BsaWI family type II restriction enzyme [bacterium]
MNSRDIVPLYQKYKALYGKQVYQYFSEILTEARAQHQRDWEAQPEEERKVFEQSWHSVKGACLEKLILLVLGDLSAEGNIYFVGDKKLKSKKLKPPLSVLREALLVDYGDRLGEHLPDADLIAYVDNPPRILAILSIKSSLRERIAHVAYWKLKTQNSQIPYFFITTDSDGDFTKKEITKSRAIAETDTSSVYLLTLEEMPFNEDDKNSRVKSFHHLIDDLKKLAEDG